MRLDLQPDKPRFALSKSKDLTEMMHLITLISLTQLTELTDLSKVERFKDFSMLDYFKNAMTALTICHVLMQSSTSSGFRAPGTVLKVITYFRILPSLDLC